MDRQKTIPPLSTKITRKLAQESADHNTLMNFYSQISRDESGAPKKWKMSSTLHIDEESIKSKKLSTGKGSGSGSNKGTPTNSRENSNERKNQINNSLQKSQKSGRKSRDESSSDQNSSRESSVENKSDDKKLKKKNISHKGRSSSGDPGHHRKRQTSSIETGKKKRGPRPKSLDLSSRTMANGDDDNFKSPDPLTPCNIAVKRKKGRPKETPPVLYAEPPVEQSPVDSSVDSETEELSPPIKRKPGRPKKVKVLTALGKGEKLKSFNMKRYEGRGLKQYGSKLSKSTLTKGFRKMSKVPTLKPVALSNENVESDISIDSMEIDETRSEIKEEAQIKENGMSAEKRKPGRPPGAKNKKNSLTSSLITRAKAVKPRKKSKFGSVGMKIAVNKKSGRQPGTKNKMTLQKLAENVETISNSSKENSVVTEKEVPVSVESERDPNIALDIKPNAIDEAIESVVFKARNDLSLESNIKKRVPFRSSVFYKKLSSVKSVGKFKKEKDIIQKIRKKRILNAHYSDSGFGKEIELLASNDLRRKLHSKLLQKMSTESQINLKATEVLSNANDRSERIDISENYNLGENKIKADTVSELSGSNLEESTGIGDAKVNVPPGKIEEKKLFRPDTDQLIDNIKTVRKQSIDITKFSDTDSVCSELSTNSISSVRRNIEKQVLILGEDNLDSDDQTVRTRQRFEIIPGKKRKRTLSGEFDLLDEKQLRKEKRKVERGLTDDESEMNSVESVVPVKKSLFKRKKSPLKKSPNLKVKEGKVVKKYISQLTAYRHRMLKQSPFLSRVRKRRRKHLREGVSDSLLDSFKKPKSKLSVEQISDERLPLENASNKQLEKSEKSHDETQESGMVKSESYRKGLFEKFTDVTLENKTDMVVKKLTSETKRKQKQEYMDNDATEYTFDLKEDVFSEDPDDVLVEESVDDSDTIDFHAEVDTESSNKELYTQSEIDVREMLFDLINEVVLKCEPKSEGKIETFLEKQFDKDNEEKECIELVKETFLDNSNEKEGDEEMVELIAEKQDVKASEQKVDTDEIASGEDKDSHILSELEPLENPETGVIKDSASIQEKAKTPGVAYIPKPKHKVRRRKFGPKSLAKKEQDNVIKEFKVRKKPGRKPKKAIEQGTVNDINATLHNVASTSPNESKSSPETSTMRKFELRQKISRSPLDNIALKQSIEENVYLRNEAQKASRKEAKLKTKAKLAVQDSLELVSQQKKDVDTRAETPVLKATENLSERETVNLTIEDLVKACKPCKVVLKDFIKELERTQEEGENFCDSETETHEVQNVSDDEKNLDKNISGPEVEAVSETQGDCTVENTKNNESVCKLSDMSDSPEASIESKCATVNNVPSITNEYSNNERSNVHEILENCDNKNKIAENADSGKLNEMTENTGGEINKNENKDIIIPDITPEKKQREFRPRRKTPAKSAEHSSPKSELNLPKEAKKIICFNEQQTARKTVPPLKIKVKGGVSSRRKTYMVEPSPDSPVEECGKNENKTEKRKGKNKTKTGNKSESDSEKHTKGHHHHKKRNKTPTEEVSSLQNKASSTTHIFETLGGSLSMMHEKPAVRATDAYEATFLQFIQDKDKNEQNHTAFSSTYGSRNKPIAQNMQKAPHYKDSKLNNNIETSISLSAKVEENVPVPFVNDSADSVDNSEVQYVCSQCDNVVYKAKEQIIQHYRDVHPGLQFIYKPLTEADDNLISANDITQGTIQSDRADMSATASNENNLSQASSEANDQPPDDDDDSGSLNLKIVEVVSLKDQQNIIDSAADVSKEDQVTTVSPMLTSHMQTELRVPSYPAPPPPPYPIQCVPPPPYSVAAGGTLFNMNTAVPEISQLKPQASVKPRTQVQSGKIGSSFKCEKCNVHAPMLAAMVAHLRNSHKEIPRLFQCPYCKDMEAETEAMIHQHIKKHHPTNNPNPPVALSEPAKRNLKTLSVRLPDGLKLGEGNSIEKDIYMCLKCKEHMPSLETIYEHLEHEHAEVFAYVCPVCKVFKSKTEDLVNNHIITRHGRSPVEVNVSLAIDGNHFVRIQCLIKDKGKSGQKSAQSVSLKTQVSPVSNLMQPNKSAIQAHGQAATNVLQLQPITQAILPHGVTFPSQSVTSPQSVNVSQQQTTLNVTTQPEVPKPAAPPVQKKKKSLLESIQKIKDQKLEQQGLQTQKNGTSTTQIVPSHPSQLSSVKSISAAGGVPPPLMRAPPPLIRYDQLNKVSSAQAVMLSSAVRTSSQFTFSNQTIQASLQRPQGIAGTFSTQSATAARPIQSSLFDTSDLDSLKSPQNQTTVLNVPFVPRRTNKSPFPKSPPSNPLSEGTTVVTTGSPLDLSKTTPTGSPAPQNIQSASPGHLQLPNGGVNPDVFQVFNLRPSTQMQLPRQQVPVQQMIAQPIMLPQQVRQNTPSTLAYRPAGPHMIATSQVQQIIGMPVSAVIGNVVVSLGNVSQGLPTVSGVTQIPPNAQFVRMASPQMPTSVVTVLNTAETSVATQAQAKTNGTGQQFLSKNMLFKCPYCPTLTPLRLDQVQHHIENKHPGSTILFKPFDSK